MKITHLTQAQDFAKVLEGGNRVRGKAFCLYILRGDETKQLRVGLIIPKKLAPLAVQRNYVRRLVYSFLRENMVTKTCAGATMAIRLTDNLRDTKRAGMAEALRKDLTNILLKAEIQ